MVRLVLVIGVLAVGFVLYRGRMDDAATGNAAPAAPAVSMAGMPREFQSLLAARPDPAQILAQRGALPGLGAIRKLAARFSADDQPDAVRPFADVGRRAALRAVRRDIRRDFAALNRLSERRGGATTEQVLETLADVYSAPVLAALGADGRHDFAERVAGRTQVAQTVKVLDFEGVFVSGRRALAQVVYRLSTRAPSGHFVAREPAIWTVTLAREDHPWRFVRGLEST